MVHLGVCDEPVFSSSVPNFTDSQLGGVPHWLNSTSTVPVCTLCGASSHLVTQLYAPLLDSPHHRVLYLFGCGEVGCQNKSGAWSVVREVCEVGEVVKESVTVVKGKSEVFSDDWGVDGEDWGGGDGEEILGALTSTTEQITQSMRQLQVKECSSVGHIDQSSGVYFPPFYLYVMGEPEADIVNKSDRKKYNEFDEMAEEGGGGKEKYEKSEVKDKEFYKFYKKVKRCPEQCVRYDLGGSPLLQPPDISIPNCPKCHSPRRFEFQLMPALISILNFPPIKGAASSKSLDYRTVIIYTCQRDCVISDSSSEYVVCVPEPDVVIPSQRTADGNSQSGS